MSRRPTGALVGVAAGAVTLAVAEIGAALLVRGGLEGGTASPLVAVAEAFVDLTPPWLKDFAIGTFGTYDKLALVIGMVLVLTGLCALIGLVGASRAKPLKRSVEGARNPNISWGLAAFALVGVIGVTAVASRPDFAWPDVVPTVVGTIAGLVTLDRLWSRLAEAGAERLDTEPGVMGAGAASRRAVLAWGGGLTVVGALGVLAGRTLSRAGEVVEAARAQLGRLRVQRPVTVPEAASQRVPGQTAYLTPAEEFYRIDTAISVPQVDPDTWRLRVTGMVDREIEMTFQDILDEELVEALVTLTCVSNYVGGNLAGNGLWTGLPVREVLGRRIESILPAAELDEAEKRYYSGIARAWQHDVAGSVANLNYAVALRPAEPQWRYALAVQLRKAGNLSEAYCEAQVAARLDPSSGTYRRLLEEIERALSSGVQPR